jgi:hypothetical protein
LKVSKGEQAMLIALLVAIVVVVIIWLLTRFGGLAV